MATITSTASGNWSDPTIWDSGTVPTAGDDVVIATGTTVTIDTDIGNIGSDTGTNDAIRVEGELRWNGDVNCNANLYGNLVNNGTLFLDGSSSKDFNFIVTYSFTNENEINSTNGIVNIKGFDRGVRWTVLSNDALSTDSTIQVENLYNWQVGDTIRIADYVSLQKAFFTITAIDTVNNIITLDSQIGFDVAKYSIVINYTSNIVFQVTSSLKGTALNPIKFKSDPSNIVENIVFDNCSKTNYEVVYTGENFLYKNCLFNSENRFDDYKTDYKFEGCAIVGGAIGGNFSRFTYLKNTYGFLPYSSHLDTDVQNCYLGIDRQSSWNVAGVNILDVNGYKIQNSFFMNVNYFKFTGGTIFEGCVIDGVTSSGNDLNYSHLFLDCKFPTKLYTYLGIGDLIKNYNADILNGTNLDIQILNSKAELYQYTIDNQQDYYNYYEHAYNQTIVSYNSNAAVEIQATRTGTFELKSRVLVDNQTSYKFDLYLMKDSLTSTPPKVQLWKGTTLLDEAQMPDTVNAWEKVSVSWFSDFDGFIEIKFVFTSDTGAEKFWISDERNSFHYWADGYIIPVYPRNEVTPDTVAKAVWEYSIRTLTDGYFSSDDRNYLILMKQKTDKMKFVNDSIKAYTTNFPSTLTTGSTGQTAGQTSKSSNDDLRIEIERLRNLILNMMKKGGF